MDKIYQSLAEKKYFTKYKDFPWKSKWVIVV
jgi:hypothetical protein